MWVTKIKSNNDIYKLLNPEQRNTFRSRYWTNREIKEPSCDWFITITIIVGLKISLYNNQ